MNFTPWYRYRSLNSENRDQDVPKALGDPPKKTPPEGAGTIHPILLRLPPLLR